MFPNNIAVVCSNKCHNDMDEEICKLLLKPILKKHIENWKKIQVNDLVKYL
jgi:hypothetical protein